MTNSPHTTNLSAETLALAQDCFFDLTVPHARLTECAERVRRLASDFASIAERADTLANDLQGHLTAMDHHLGELARALGIMDVKRD